MDKIVSLRGDPLPNGDSTSDVFVDAMRQVAREGATSAVIAYECADGSVGYLCVRAGLCASRGLLETALDLLLEE